MAPADEDSPPSSPRKTSIGGSSPNSLLLPKLWADCTSLDSAGARLPHNITAEGQERREGRLRVLWNRLSSPPTELLAAAFQTLDSGNLTLERVQRLEEIYFLELISRCRPNGSGVNEEHQPLDWNRFTMYADAKEKELWNIFHNELVLDREGRLDASEWSTALDNAGISIDPRTFSGFMASLTSSPGFRTISFSEFRDFLLFMPRTASVDEIYRYYELRKILDDDSHGPALVNMGGDVSLSAEDGLFPDNSHSHKTPELEAPVCHASLSDSIVSSTSPSPAVPTNQSVDPDSSDHEHSSHGKHNDNDNDNEGAHIFGGPMALKYLLAGGVAGVVSRTATAPFDRLKVYLITASAADLNLDSFKSNVAGVDDAHSVQQIAPRRTRTLTRAITNIYGQGGVKAFWVGNGLNAAKIFPESAIKFMSYETSKRIFAKYIDHVDDPREISGVSRFISGGVGGITSQLAIYPIETLKTQLMSTAKGADISLLPAMKRVWALGGIPAYYRGLIIGLIGVFPYSAIDMSTFEALKLAYARSTGHPEPGVLALLAFGSISGSVGATSVYPLNLVRTRLQASGSSGHPQHYTGIMDVVRKTYAREGWRGFYKGLAPTLAKVVPAVSISYVVYEQTKRRLGVA